MANYKDVDLEVRKQLAADPSTTAEILEELSKNSEAEIRCLVAGNPNTSIEVLYKLGKDFPEAIIANPFFNLLALEDPTSLRFMKLCFARSSTTSEEKLAELAKTEEHDEEILCAIAKHINTPVNVLEKLAFWYDNHPTGNKVRSCVASNPKTPILALKELADANSSLIRACVAQNHNIPSDILEQLAQDRDAMVREALFNNSQISASTLEYLALDHHEKVRSTVLNHPNASVLAIEIVHAVESGMKESIYLVDILDKMVSDRRFHVWHLIIKYLDTPPIILDKLSLKLAKYLGRFRYSLSTEVEEVLIDLINHAHITEKALLELINTDIDITSIFKKHNQVPSNLLNKYIKDKN